MKNLNFSVLKKAVDKQFKKMEKGTLFITDTNKDTVWDVYLSNFPEGTNEIYRERREYDCQCCKQFIRACGNVVCIVDYDLQSIWDVEVGGQFQPVVDALSKYVKSRPITKPFYYEEKTLGTNKSQGIKDDILFSFEHFFHRLPNKFVKQNIATLQGNQKINKAVFQRSLEEITFVAIATVLELIEQKSIYRGEENKKAVKDFLVYKERYRELLSEDEKDLYCWEVATLSIRSIGAIIRIKNTAIGTLLSDISVNVPLDEAVRLFESKVAPEKYKRPTTVVTKSMIKNAQKEVAELGIEKSLNRRFATIDDVTINNVLFANRQTKKEMNVFDELVNETAVNIQKLKKVEDVDIKTFIDDILPKADSVELLFTGNHSNNLMSLIAPEDFDAPNILKWDNNFSWAYNGEVADSMRQRVKKAGGKVDGVLRFSIQWNDEDNNQNDFDAHCIEPNGNLIHFANMENPRTRGNLDVDIINPSEKVAVENITWPNLDIMEEGIYTFKVHNYNHCGGRTGFTAEIEYDGQIYSYAYDKELRNNEKVTVAELNFSRRKGIKFIKSLSATTASKEIWGINTQNFQNVSMIMNSPNHWDGEQTGNKHFFFILSNCKNPDNARGFFNEFLKNDLNEHRKVFEVLGSKLRAENTGNQLSGLGFSSTKKNKVVCKITGSFSRIININFN